MEDSVRKGPFKAGIGMLVAGTPAQVVPCYLDGPFEAFPAGSMVPRRHKVRLTIGPPRAFADVASNRAGWDHIGATLEQDVKLLGGVG